MAAKGCFRLTRLGIFLIVIVAITVGANGASFMARVGDKKCMRVLGCFEITSDFYHLLRRPVNLLPQDRAVINTKFLLYTNSNIREKHILDAEKKDTITSSYFDPKVPTKFIIHGYIDTQTFGPWQEKLKDEFLLKGRHNVIIVDWSGGNGLPYTQATANTRVVGAEIAYLIKILQATNGLDPGDCHILGHSLGSHVAGYAGERTPGLGRITGLDPAEPYFQGLPPSVRLDETDAKYVDAIHTDSNSILLLGLGMSQPVGHVDFYPNDGRNQPGCEKEKILSFITDGLTEGLRRFVGCNHQRSVDFYQASVVLTRCAPVAYECSSWKDFLDAKCTECGADGSKCAILGDRAIESKGLKQKNKKLYLKTASKKPYCLHHYKIQIKLYRAKDAKDAKGKLELKLDDFTAKLTSSDVSLFPGSTYTYLITTQNDLSKLRSVSLRWKSSGTILNPLNWFRSPKIYIDFIKVVPMNIIDQAKKAQNTKSFCPSNRNNPVDSGKDAVIREGSC